ncbi:MULTISPECIES: lactate racemase domain-containing protein [unclassified Anaeromyxobacter]|uniref:lactate racemase domain-containing protein n=1 Tax=unclassified Anaeromyxobacter TaxID=2620896 RepID=UPI001F594068|nr:MULTISPECIES: lactate racemase domain-containing protein [unclassified Anaeromyxobacter]
MTVLLGYGTRPLALPDLAGARVLLPPAPPPVPDLEAAIDAALAHPVGARPLATVATARTRVVVIVSDASRDEPRAELFAAVRRALGAVPDDHLTIAVANGTHGPKPLERLGLPAAVLGRHRVVNHDARDDASMVEMGRTSRGTRIRVNRCVAEADLIVSTGRVKPHYFAGWGGGAKGIFPGLGHDVDIRQNHRLKAEETSALGRADGNPCREDLEEAVRRIGRDTYLVNVVEAGGTIVGAVAGDVVYAHREGVRLARPWCEVEAPKADVVIVSAPLPVSGSLYQASKLIPPAGLLLREGGVVIVAAECPEGTGPLQVVNEGIFELGVRRYLPAGATVLLVSGMDEATVRETYATFAPDLAAAIASARERVGREATVLVLPDAGDLVPRAV